MTTLQAGNRLIAVRDETRVDHVTCGKAYTVLKVDDFGGFWIVNDKGEEVFPVSSEFKAASTNW